MLRHLKAGGCCRVIGWDGRPLTRDDLPPGEQIRWNARRKAVIVAAVRGGLIGFGEALWRYRLSPAEYAAWERAALAALIPHPARPAVPDLAKPAMAGPALQPNHAAAR